VENQAAVAGVKEKRVRKGGGGTGLSGHYANSPAEGSSVGREKVDPEEGKVIVKGQ